MLEQAHPEDFVGEGDNAGNKNQRKHPRRPAGSGQVAGRQSSIGRKSVPCAASQGPGGQKHQPIESSRHIDGLAQTEGREQQKRRDDGSHHRPGRVDRIEQTDLAADLIFSVHRVAHQQR